MTETLRRDSEEMRRPLDRISPVRDDRMIGIAAHTTAGTLIRRAIPARSLPMVQLPTGETSFDKIRVDSDGHTRATHTVEHVEMGVQTVDEREVPFRKVTAEEVSVATDLLGKPAGSVDISYVEYDQEGVVTASRGLTYAPSDNGGGPILEVRQDGQVIEGLDRVGVILELNTDLNGFEAGVEALINSQTRLGTTQIS